MIVVELLQIEANALAIPKSLLLADIETKLTTTSLSMRLNSLAINLCSLTTVPCLFLMMNTLELCPFCIC
jgi:hypothetical protein